MNLLSSQRQLRVWRITSVLQKVLKKKKSSCDACAQIKLKCGVVRFASFRKHFGQVSHKWNKACDKIFEVDQAHQSHKKLQAILS